MLLRFALGTAALAAALSAAAQAPGTPAAPTASTPPARDVRFVVVHTPGPQWDRSRPVFEQPGLQAHVDHYRKLLQQGKLELGGPFMDGSGGGMMIPAAGLREDEIRSFAQQDPAVVSGLLVAEVRPWLIGMTARARAAS